jgi:hypothetical protein
MPRPELHRTLVAAVDAVSPRVTSGLVVTEAQLDLPLEIVVVAGRDGRPVIAGSVPHSRWRAGFVSEARLSRLHIEAVATDGR